MIQKMFVIIMMIIIIIIIISSSRSSPVMWACGGEVFRHQGSGTMLPPQSKYERKLARGDGKVERDP
jgi:hypothetical protein